MRRAFITSISACIALLAPAAEAEALKCVAGITHEEALKRSDLVFEGIVVGKPDEVRIPGEPIAFPEYRFRVARYLNGEEGPVIAVHQLPIAGAPPDTQLPRPGEAWRVYAERRAPGKYAFELCPPQRYTGALHGTAATEVRELVADRTGPAQGSADENDGFPAWLLGLAGIAIAAALAHGSRMRRGRDGSA